MKLRNLNNYEKNIVVEFLKEAEAKAEASNNIEALTTIKRFNSIEVEAEAEAEAISFIKNNIIEAEAEAEAEAKAEAFKKALAEAEAKEVYKILKASLEAEAEAEYIEAEALAEAEAEALEVNNNYNYYYISAEAIAQNYYNEKILEAEASLIEAEAEAEAEAFNLSLAIAEASNIDLINFIHMNKINFIVEVKAEAKAKAFNYVLNNIEVIAEASIKEAKAKAKASLLKEAEAFKTKAKVKALVLTSNDLNNIEPYYKKILLSYINFNHIDNIKFKGKYDKINHIVLSEVISLNLTLHDETYYIIIDTNFKRLNLLKDLALKTKALTKKDKYILRSVKTSAKASAKASKSLEAEAEYINNTLEAKAEVLIKGIDKKYINRYNINLYLNECLTRALLVEAEAEAEAEAKAEVKAYLKDLALNDYFKFNNLKGLLNISFKEAEALKAEASALSNQYTNKTTISDYLKGYNVFKNKKSVNKVSAVYGLVSSKASAYSSAEVINSIKDNFINLAEVKAEAEAEAKAKYLAFRSNLEAEAIAEASIKSIKRSNLDYFNMLKNINEYINLSEAIAEAEAEALAIQHKKFFKALEVLNIDTLEALKFKKAIDLI